MTAAGYNEPALEIPESGHGLFTHYFLEGLRAANVEGEVTVDECYRYLYTKVQERAATYRAPSGEPYRQTPELRAYNRGSFVLRELTGTHHAVGLRVAYGAQKPFSASVPSEPRLVPAPASYAVTVDGERLLAPLFVYLFRVVRAGDLVRTERLLPDGENLGAPPATVARGRRAVFPDPAETGEPVVKVREDERAGVDVLFILLTSEAEIEDEAVSRVERLLFDAAERERDGTLGVLASAALDRDPDLKLAAKNYVFLRHEPAGVRR
jgi:hypothetical protein